MDRIAKILLTAESIWAFGSGLFLPICAIFSQKVGGDILDAGIAAALFLIATSTLEWPLGRVLDKYHEKWFIAIAYFLTGFIFIGYAFVTNKWELFVLQILLGVASAIGDPSWEALYDKHTADSRSGSSWSFYHMFSGYAAAFGVLIGAGLVHFFGFDLVFILGAVFAFLAGLTSAVFIKKFKREA